MAIDMSIAALKQKITEAEGLQRSNRFLVTIDSELFEDGNEDAADGSRKGYYAEEVLLPNISLTTQADGLAGPGAGRTVPKGLSYKGGVYITFPIFGDLIFLNSMNAWMKTLYYQNQGNPSVWVTNYYENTIQSASSKVTVDLLDVNGVTKGRYQFIEAFPVEIAPIRFSAKTRNDYATMIVRFAFREYTFTNTIT